MHVRGIFQLTETCEICGNGIGYKDIHEIIHYMIDNKMIPDDPNPQIRNSLILNVWNELSFFKNVFLNNIQSSDYTWSNKLVPIQRIDRELRHVLQPRKRSQIAKLLEVERYQHHVKIKRLITKGIND